MLDKRKILVLMSGGVDSSTAAALLVREGHEVGGVYLKLWEIDRRDQVTSSSDLVTSLGDPCWAREMQDAARVAAHLGIPFQVWEVTEEYKARVLENFYSEYAAGRTPNPDVLCNSEIKFGVGLERAMAMGYEYVATGHYARIASSVERRASSDHLNAKRYTLYAARDSAKDQSYFLWRLTQDQLAHIMFPIGDYTKPQVRAMAREFGLHNWNKKDSQGVCFLGKIRLKEFLSQVGVGRGFIPRRGGAQGPVLQSASTGPIVDVHGQLLGFHDGLAHFTIGQRQGTRLGGTGPYFVVDKDLTTNTLVVAHEREEEQYRAVECTVRDVQVTSYKLQVTRSCMARTRYRAPFVPVRVHFHTLAYESGGRVVFDEPQRAVAPGQSIVFYDGEQVIGGGVIDNVQLKTPLEICKVPTYAQVS